MPSKKQRAKAKKQQEPEPEPEPEPEAEPEPESEMIKASELKWTTPGGTKRKGWSQKYYKGLSADQHEANNNWADSMRGMMKPTGQLMVPNLNKVFDINLNEQ